MAVGVQPGELALVSVSAVPTEGALACPRSLTPSKWWHLHLGPRPPRLIPWLLAPASCLAGTGWQSVENICRSGAIHSLPRRSPFVCPSGNSFAPQIRGLQGTCISTLPGNPSGFPSPLSSAHGGISNFSQGTSGFGLTSVWVPALALSPSCLAHSRTFLSADQGPSSRKGHLLFPRTAPPAQHPPPSPRNCPSHNLSVP